VSVFIAAEPVVSTVVGLVGVVVSRFASRSLRHPKAAADTTIEKRAERVNDMMTPPAEGSCDIRADETPVK
jgi:hypothetical protein